MDLNDVERGDEISDGVVFLEWNLSRLSEGVECPRCGGYAPEVDSTPEEIESELNCGRSWACCCAAFVCNKCGTRLVGHREAPEMDYR
jgi:hypothetical protein